MKFSDLLETHQTPEVIVEKSSTKDSKEDDKKTHQTPEDILRHARIKIKMVTPTRFGTQIDFAKKYDNKDIEKLLKDFTLKFDDDDSVFVMK